MLYFQQTIRSPSRVDICDFSHPCCGYWEDLVLRNPLSQRGRPAPWYVDDFLLNRLLFCTSCLWGFFFSFQIGAHIANALKPTFDCRQAVPIAVSWIIFPGHWLQMPLWQLRDSFEPMQPMQVRHMPRYRNCGLRCHMAEGWCLWNSYWRCTTCAASASRYGTSRKSCFFANVFWWPELPAQHQRQCRRSRRYARMGCRQPHPSFRSRQQQSSSQLCVCESQGSYRVGPN
jgi:hypothetical protein